MRSRTTLRQWRAFEACIIDKLPQAQAAERFGVTQSAISRRIRRYLEATGQLEQLGRSGRRRRQLVNVVSLSNFTDTELPQRSRR
jgi:DNA-binding transcriptional LysR family regulator